MASVEGEGALISDLDLAGLLDTEGEVTGGGRVPDEEGDDEAEEDSDCRAVIRVLTTQIGFVMSTVADPAMAPAIMDSSVVRLLLARDVRIAARSKKERVHSYPAM